MLRNFDERLKYLRNLEEKKEQVLSTIREQGKLTPELEKQIREAMTLVVGGKICTVQYRPKRRTRDTIAREKGLQPLADHILLQMAREPLEKTAAAYIDEDKEVRTAQEAIDGAKDILAEQISDEADIRMYIRKATYDRGLIRSAAKDENVQSVYEMYYDYQEPVKKAAGHRILALNRGESEKILTVKIEAPAEDILRYLEKKIIVNDNPYTKPALKEAAADSYDRLIAPAIERDIRNELTRRRRTGPYAYSARIWSSC